MFSKLLFRRYLVFIKFFHHSSEICTFWHILFTALLNEQKVGYLTMGTRYLSKVLAFNSISKNWFIHTPTFLYFSFSTRKTYVSGVFSSFFIKFPCCSYTFIKENVLYHRVNFLYHRVNISRRHDCWSLNFIYFIIIFRIMNSKNDVKY